MLPGLDTETLLDLRKTKIIDRELDCKGIDVAALQETRLLETGNIKEENYTFFWSGYPTDHPKYHGVGFAVRNSLVNNITTQCGLSARLMTLNLDIHGSKLRLVSCYAPTLKAPVEEKDAFYLELSSTLSTLGDDTQPYLLGDFNARVGRRFTDWPQCLGQFGVGNMNENGQRALELCSYHQMCITNTYFDGPSTRKTSWMHPRSKHWHQIDLHICRRDQLKTVCSTRAYKSADCDTDHSLIVSRIKLLKDQPQLHRAADKPKHRKYHLAFLNVPSVKNSYATKLAQQLGAADFSNAHESWEGIKHSLHAVAKEVAGYKPCKELEWFDLYSHLMIPAIEEKRRALLDYQQRKDSHSLDQLRAKRAAVKKLTKQCTEDYWTDLCESIQRSFDIGDIRGMYQGIRRAIGPKVVKTAPLLSKDGVLLTTKQDQMGRWKEHFEQLYGDERPFTVGVAQDLPASDPQTELDDTPDLEEIRQAISALPNHKAHGVDGVAGELLKAGGDQLVQTLHSLMEKCWETGEVPSDFVDSQVVTIYKNKGSRNDCNNYRGISLLSVTGKLLARVILVRLRELAESVLPESQCGFRADRSTVDMIFSIKLLQEKAREHNQHLFMAFIDLTKAFDYVSREGLWILLERIGCPPKLLRIIKALHTGTTGSVVCECGQSETFNIRAGVKQGCVLAPTLFAIFFAIVFKSTFPDEGRQHGVYLHTRTDGGLFNLSRLRAHTKVVPSYFREFLYADDAAFAADSESSLQEMLTLLNNSCKRFGLVISKPKTVVMTTSPSPLNITLDNVQLTQVEDFTYLGTSITTQMNLDVELDRRIGRAARTFGQLRERAWENRQLKICTKMSIYRACVISTLLYGSEAWATYAKHERRLNSFHLRCLRKILDVKWHQHIPDTEILERCEQPPVTTLLKAHRLRWLGHVKRMQDDRIPKRLLFSAYPDAPRNVGRPKLRYTDVCKRDMKAFNVNPKDWEALALDRTKWRDALSKGKDSHKEQYTKHRQELRSKRHQDATDSADDAVYPCPACAKPCRSRIGLYSHKRSCQLFSRNSMDQR